MKIEEINKNQEKVLHILSELSERDKIILSLRFNNRRTQQEVAKELNITPERIRQLEDRSLKVISKYFK